MKKITIVAVIIIAVIAYASWSAGGKWNSTTVINERIVEVTPIPEVMIRIGKCESEGKHYGQSGQVIMRANANGTVDVGKYQINSVHFAEATKMGLDLTREADNEAFAMHLYQTQGTEPWKYSRACWSK